jgi:hypothetical protein
MIDTITPCIVCRSLERRPGELWKHACPKHDAVLEICCTSVEEGIQSAKRADLDDLQIAFQFEVRRRGSRKSLRIAIAREIKKRLKFSQNMGTKKGAAYAGLVTQKGTNASSQPVTKDTNHDSACARPAPRTGF